MDAIDESRIEKGFNYVFIKEEATEAVEDVAEKESTIVENEYTEAENESAEHIVISNIKTEIMNTDNEILNEDDEDCGHIDGVDYFTPIKLQNVKMDFSDSFDPTTEESKEDESLLVVHSVKKRKQRVNDPGGVTLYPSQQGIYKPRRKRGQKKRKRKGSNDESGERKRESFQNRVDYLAYKRERTAYLRLMETPEERQLRLSRMREYAAAKRQRETSEQRERRLARLREYIASKRHNETPEQREQRLAQLREYTMAKRQNETVEQRQRRLALHRQYTTTKRQNESPEQRELRLSQLREYTTVKRQNETFEQRERRLSQLREYIAYKRQNDNSEQSKCINQLREYAEFLHQQEILPDCSMTNLNETSETSQEQDTSNEATDDRSKPHVGCRTDKSFKEKQQRITQLTQMLYENIARVTEHNKFETNVT